MIKNIYMDDISNNFIRCQGAHKCVERVSRSNCPVCQEDIHTSRIPSQVMMMMMIIMIVMII